MKRVSVQELKPGISLAEPIYTQDRKLLLAAGLPFTREMQDALRDGAWKYVYVGEWSETDAARFASATPLAAYRAEAERMADTLLRAFQSDLSATDVSAPPMGLPLTDNVNRQLQPPRSENLRNEFQRRRRETGSLVENICEGLLPAERVSGAAAAVLDTVLSQFCSDPSLAANLANLKGAGDYLYTHSVNRAVLSMHIGAGLGYSRKQVADLALAALVADLGMTMVPRNLVNAPRRLTAHEFSEIQRHALYTLHAVKKIPGLPDVVPFVAYQLHERDDGSGYPGRRRSGYIHRFAAIVAVADAFDAMSSPRPWRAAMAPYRAMETLIKEAARGKFDREAVRALLHYVSLFPIGSLVRLNTGEIGKVIHATGKTYDRPVIALLFDGHGNPRPDRLIADLSSRPDLKIEGFVDGAMGVPLEAGF